MNVNPLNEAILSSAESILRNGYSLSCDFGGDVGKQDAAWVYLHADLLPIHVAWQARVTGRRALHRYAAELAENATAIASHDGTPPALTFRYGLTDGIARHVIGFRLSQETRVHNPLDDVAGDINQTIPSGSSTIGCYRCLVCFTTSSLRRKSSAPSAPSLTCHPPTCMARRRRT
jgi:hypothetical protein